jgi:Zn-dependent protease
MTPQKTYYSFYDVPYGGFNEYTTPGMEPRLKFSQREIVQILIAMTVLTVAFSFALAPYPPLSHFNAVIRNLPLSFLAIGTAFFCHEIAHKYMGQKYGYWSEFRMFPQGLLFALFLGVTLGIVFAAPGAVQIFGRPTREESGKMAAAGPSMNLAISFVFMSIWRLASGNLAEIAFFIAYINAFLAFFNLLPFGPLDGRKVLRWKIAAWGVLMATCIGFFILLIF